MSTRVDPGGEERAEMAMRLAARSLGLMQSSAGFIRRGGNAGNSSVVRSFSSSANHDDAYETAKWEKITYLGIVSCTLLAAYNLSRGHPHSEEPLAYSYLHIRNKEFPWGPDGLFETKHSEH